MSKTHLPLPRHHIQLRRASIALLDALRREHPTIIAHLKGANARPRGA